MAWSIRYKFEASTGSIVVGSHEAALHCAKGLLAIGSEALEISRADALSEDTQKRRQKTYRIARSKDIALSRGAA